MPDYFTLAELRAMPDVSSTSTYPDARVEAAAAYIVGVIERVVGTSFIGRTVTDEVYDGGCTGIVLKAGYVQAVSSATLDGAAVTETLLVRSGVLYRVTGTNNTPIDWPEGHGNVTVTYTAGYSSTVPGDVKEQALKGTRAHLLAGGGASSMNERRTSLSTEMGIVGLTVAGGEQYTGYPELDSTIQDWERRLASPKVA